jgi:hypothetical protein
LGAAGSCHVQGYDGRMTGSSPPRLASRVALGVGIASLLLIAACGPAVPASPSGGASNPRISDEPTAPGTPTASADTGQTDTDWGRVWDALPEAFPVYPGATPADDAAPEVVSATFALEGTDARAVAGWMQTELERARYATEALNGPLEDGSFVLDLAGAGDCRIQVSVAPLGNLTTVAVRYGAGCPKP